MVKNYISGHYVKKLRIPQLADMIGMAPTAFSRYFKLRTGKSLTEYIIDIRLGFATRRLVDTTESVAEICYACGFNTISNFNRFFRKRKGCSPVEFRQRYCKTKVIV
jgi:AraC-like DNA-binding protein